MVKKLDRAKARAKRQFRVRKKITGTPECPRLNVFRSSKHIYAQIIDDVNGVTLACASTMDKDFSNAESKVATARLIGKAVAEKGAAKGVTKVVFDRAGYLYHGRIKELAEGAREGGLQF